ncbi:metallophosphoesterase [Methylothermus subterraneus]
MPKTFCLAHLSDPHLTSPNAAGARELFNKRLLGYLSWQLYRRREHRPEVLKALTQDLKAHNPDHIAITGDLTQLGLRCEYRQAADWLAQLGPPAQVTVVPGNHDRYVAASWQESLGLWEDYLKSDAGKCLFPLRRERGPVVLLGIDSAPPTAPFLATGSVGQEQLKRLAERLELELGRCRILLIHHPPHPDAVKPRKRLTDQAELGKLLARTGCGLILHGHSHRWQLHWLKGPKAPIPVLGAPSASAWGVRRGSRARYHLCRITQSDGGFQIEVEIRGFCQRVHRFLPEGLFRLETLG